MIHTYLICDILYVWTMIPAYSETYSICFTLSSKLFKKFSPWSLFIRAENLIEPQQEPYFSNFCHYILFISEFLHLSDRYGSPQQCHYQKCLQGNGNLLFLLLKDHLKDSSQNSGISREQVGLQIRLRPCLLSLQLITGTTKITVGKEALNFATVAYL